MGGIGGPELFLVLLVVLLVFGPKKIPEFARGIGKGLREFRKLSTDFQREINISAALEEDEKRVPGRPRPSAATSDQSPSAVPPVTPAPGPPGSAAPASATAPEPEAAAMDPDAAAGESAEPPVERDDSRGDPAA